MFIFPRGLKQMEETLTWGVPFLTQLGRFIFPALLERRKFGGPRRDPLRVQVLKNLVNRCQPKVGRIRFSNRDFAWHFKLATGRRIPRCHRTGGRNGRRSRRLRPSCGSIPVPRNRSPWFRHVEGQSPASGLKPTGTFW